MIDFVPSGCNARRRASVRARAAATLIGAFSILLLSLSAEAATYYVAPAGSDGNPGSLQQPFRTIKRGLQSLRAGDTLFIRTGTYTEHLMENDFGASGTASAWITVAAYPGESVTLVNGGYSEVIRFQDGTKHHIEWKDLVIDGGKANTGYGIFMVGFPGCCGDLTLSHDLKFTNIEVKDTWMNGIIGGGSNHQFINLRVHGTGRVPPEVYQQGANGVYFYGDNSRFEGGEYYDNLCYGIRIADSDTGHRASGNVITRVRTHHNGPGVGLNYSSRCGSSGGGIVMGDSSNTVENSLIYSNSLGIDLVGLSGKAVQDAKILQNTFYANSGYAIGVGLFAGAARTQIKNNIMWSNGSNIMDYGGSSTVTTANVTSDPKFNNAAGGDFTVQPGSVAIDAGVALPEVSDDFAGKPRPRGAGYDVGAFEYSSGGPTPPPDFRFVQ